MANAYDKIIKETMNDIVEVLINKVLGISATRITSLETKMQITNEREADFIVEIEESGKIYILHIEFQTTNDYDMPYRMLFYWNFIKVNHRKPVRQCLFYIGKEPLRMSNKIPDPKLSSYDYELIDFRTIDCDTFIKSNDPKSIVISILCDYRGKDVTLFIREILERIKATVKEETLRNKYIRQVEVLSRLRNMQNEFSKEVDKMPIILDIEGDVRFKQGRERGLEEGRERGLEEGRERGLEDGLKAGIELAMEIKFGTDILTVMDIIKEIDDIYRLEWIKESIKKASSFVEFKQMTGIRH